MKAHLLYLRYVLRHKWYVFQECLRLGVPIWIAILHDWDKFLPGEWFPYVSHFYGKSKSGRAGSGVGYIKQDDVGDPAFDRAVAVHISRNKHHWEYWVAGDLASPMPDVFRREMLADWRGAGRAQGTTDNRTWYGKNYARINLHPVTRQWVDVQLGILGDGV